jgi:release factor glutamine methyltransferase
VSPPQQGPVPSASILAVVTSETWTILRVLNWTAQRFAERGLPTPRLDAEVLLAHVLGCDRVALYVRHDQPLVQDELERARAMVRRRLAREPAAYLTGTKEFWSLRLSVDRRVLIPRPETELLVEIALDLTANAPAGVLCDVGCGSGAVALALKKERPAWRVLATDVSPDAIEVARANASRLDLALELRVGDLLEPVADAAPLDLVVCNPPYITDAEIDELAPEVREHEPRLALTAGADGLDVIRRLVAAAPPALAPGGALVLEIAPEQRTAVASLLEATGAFSAVEFRRDLARRDRAVLARRR